MKFNKKDSYFYLSIAVYALWICINYEKLTHPIFMDALDYLFILRENSFFSSSVWSSNFFRLVDGHPPLVTVPYSFLVYVTGSIFTVKTIFLLINLAAFQFFFLWARKLSTPLWITGIFAGLLLFSPVHSHLLTRPIGDFLGFSLLLGWLFYRYKNKNIKSMLILLMAMMIRETHALPAIVFLIILLFEKENWKTAWVEIIPGMVLAFFFLLSKIMTGDWYQFTGKSTFNQFNQEKLLNFMSNWLNPGRTIMPFLVLLAGYPLIRKSSFKRLFPLAALTILSSMVLFFPYLSLHPKTRLLTPYLAPAVIVFLFYFRVIGEMPWFKKYPLIVSALISIGWVDYNSFTSAIRRETHLDRIEVFYSFVENINAEDALVSGTFPFLIYTAYPVYGYPELPSIEKSRAFTKHVLEYNFKFKKNALLRHEKVIFFLDHGFLETTKPYICSMVDTCPIFSLEFAGDQYMFFIKGYSEKEIRKAWLKMSDALNKSD